MNWLKVRDFYSDKSFLVNLASIASIKEIEELHEDEVKTLVQINFIGFDPDDYLTVEANLDQIANRLSIAAHTIQDL